MAAAQHRLGVCILNWNAGPMLAECLRRLYAHLPELPCEVVVVDNASSDGSAEAAVAAFPQAALMRNAENVGYARGNNVGARYVMERGCSLLLFLNPDVWVEAATIPAMIETLDRDAQAGCCGGLPYNDLGVSKYACRSRPEFLEKVLFYGPLNRVKVLHPLRTGHLIDPLTLPDGAMVHALSGACLMMCAEAFREIDGFDEATFLYEEELILAERLLARDWHSVIAKTARYFHKECHSSDRIATRRHIHFLHSEQHLVKTYYRWPLPKRLLLMAYRWCALPFTAAFHRAGEVRGSSAVPSGGETGQEVL